MVITDTWFTHDEKMLLASLVGKEFEKYRIDEYVSGKCESSHGVIGLFIGGEIYALTADMEVHDFFGEQDDIAAVSFGISNLEGIAPRLVGKKQVDWSVGRTIKDILVYEDKQIQSVDGKNIFEYRWVGAIVFKMDRTEVVFEPDGWIMESFGIYRGPSATKSIASVDADLEEDERDLVRAERSITSLKQWASQQ